MEKFKQIEEIIGQAIHEAGISFEKYPHVHNYLNLAKDSYILIQWPESQQYMEEEWFEEEAILDINQPSAYFIPIKRLL